MSQINYITNIESLIKYHDSVITSFTKKREFISLLELSFLREIKDYRFKINIEKEDQYTLKEWLTFTKVEVKRIFSEIKSTELRIAFEHSDYDEEIIVFQHDFDKFIKDLDSINKKYL